MSDARTDKETGLGAARAYRDQRVLWSLVLICVLAYVPTLLHWLEGAWPFGEDAMAAFGLWREFTRNGFSQGLLPLWNPHLFCGMPFMSNGQTSILYPPNLIYWVMPVPLALVLDALGHNILLACGTYMLARALRLSRTASWLVAVSLALSGAVSAHLFNGHMTWHAARAYLPWELWALLCYLRQGRRSYIYALAVCFGLQVASGYPPLVVLSVGWCCGLTFAWMVSKAWVQRKQVIHTVLPAGWLNSVIVLVGLTFLLTAVHLLPLREVSSLAVHGRGLPYNLAVAGSGNWHSLLRFVLPEFFGNNRLSQWSLFLGAHEEAAYCGLLAAVLALGAPIFARRCSLSGNETNANRTSSHLALPIPVFWLWPLLPITAVMAMGENTFIYPWLLHHVGPLSMVRVPARWLETCCFTATLLAGFSFDGCLHRIRKASESKTPSALILLLLFSGLTIALLGLWLFLRATSAGSPLWMQTAQWNAERPLAAQIAAARWFRSIALDSTATALWLAGGMTLLLLVWQRSSGLFTKRLMEKLLLGVVLIDMVGLFWRSDKFLSPPTLNQFVLWPQRLTQLYRPGERWDTSQLSLESINQAMPLNIDLFNGYDTMGSRRFFSFIRTFEGQSFWAAAYEKHSDPPSLRVTGLTHTLSFETDPAGTSHWSLYPHEGAWPRVYLSRRLLRVPQAKQLKVLSTVAAKPFAAQGQPVVVANTSFPKVSAAPLQASDRVVQWSRNLNEMQIQTHASAPSVLVQSEAWYPGWRAWVNGLPVRVEQANFLFRGVAVPAGVSQVRVVYEPATYRFGLFLSLCGLSALGGIVMMQRRKS